MNIPLYWAEHTLVFNNPKSRKADKSSRIKRFGWSDVSLDDAKRHALERCEQARYAYENKAKWQRINFAEGIHNYDETPIREQVVEDYPALECITTINSYGATCLNVADVMILDVDEYNLRMLVKQSLIEQNTYPKRIPAYLSFIIRIVISIVLGLACYYVFHSLFISGMVFFIIWMVVGLLFLAISDNRQNNAIVEAVNKRGGFVSILDSSINELRDKRGDFSFNLYQTPNGFRLIALQKTFTVKDEDFEWVNKTLPIDKRYITMCKIQQCFRARVTGKPWRMDIDDKPPREFWHIGDRDMTSVYKMRQDWLTNYNKIAPNYRACQFIKRVGNMDVSIEPKVAKVIALHDELCQVEKVLPLA